MKRLILLASLLLLLVSGTSEAQWKQEPAMPVSLNWPQTAVANGTIYVFGGLSVNAAGTATVTKSVYSYTPGDAAWKKLTVNMPLAKYGGYAATVGGKIYITGGQFSTASTGVDVNTYEFDPTLLTFTTKADMPFTTSEPAGALVDGKMFIMGGITYQGSQGYYSQIVGVYDPATDTWTQATSKAPYNGEYEAAAGLNGKIYLFGGDGNTGYFTNVWQGEFDGSDVSWSQVSDLPEGITRASAGSIGGKLIVAGGTGAATPANFTQTYVYDDAADAWTKTYGLAGPIYNGAPLTTLGNSIYFIGGYLNSLVYSLVYPPTSSIAIANITPEDGFLTLAPNQTRTLTRAASNTGVANLTLNIAIPDDAKAWLSAVASPATVGSTSVGSYGVTCSAGTLSAGLYKTTVTISTNDATNPSYSFNVRMYVLPADVTTQKMKVLLEEGTGTWCGYCPQGHEISASLVDQYGGNLIALQYHGGGAVDTFIVNPAGVNLLKDLSLQGFPNASIQRWMFPGEVYQMTDRGAWAAHVQTVFDQQPNAPVTIHINNYTFDPTTGKVHAEINMRRAEAMLDIPDATIRLTTVVSENELNADGYQEDYRLPSPFYADTYTEQETVRQMYPNEFGKNIPFPTPTVVDGDIDVPGDQQTVTLDFTLTKKVQNLSNCNISFIANVVTTDSKLGSVLQAQQIPLLANSGVQAGSAVSGFSLSDNYPNPLTDATKIVYTLNSRMPVTLVVSDVLGRKVAQLVDATQDASTYTVKFDASSLTSGTYTYTLTAGDQTLSRTLNVVK